MTKDVEKHLDNPLGGFKPRQKNKGDKSIPQNELSQNTRISYTYSFQNIIVNNRNEYHPEKVNVTMTMTLDHIPGESTDELKARLAQAQLTSKFLIEKVEEGIYNKVTSIRNLGK